VGYGRYTAAFAVLHLRVSTGGQSTDNQRRVLTEVAERRGWAITATYEDAASAAPRGATKLPGCDGMLRFDVLRECCYAGRYGRSRLNRCATADMPLRFVTIMTIMTSTSD
jgi:hypothetical protein